MLDINHLHRFHREQSPHFSIISFNHLMTSSGVRAYAYGIRMFHNLAASTISIVAIHFWPRSQSGAVESCHIVLHWGMMSPSYSFLTESFADQLNGSSKKITQANPVEFLKPRLIVYSSQIPPCTSALIFRL